MKHIIIKYSIITFGWLAVLYPLLAAMASVSWGQEPVLEALFPLLGIVAFALLWLHSLSGVFEEWMRHYIDFDKFVAVTASVILACILLHPLLLLVLFKFDVMDVFAYYGVLYISLGVIGWLLLISYDIIKPLKKRYDFFAVHWDKVLLISNIGFLITFFHSLGAGSDLQSGPLRIVWIFYGITAFLAIGWTYGVKRFFVK